VTVSFHTVVTGRPASGFPIPNLQFTIVPPDGVAEPQVTESIGGTTTVNNDTHVRVWVVRIAAEGDYKIQTGGNVNGYISPRLAFGHDSSLSVLLWVFGALFVAGLLGLFTGLVWSARVGKKARPLESYEFPPMSAPSQSNPSSVPGDQGIRLEQLRQLAALRDSGALTEEEYTAEKRRILDN
jgi:hypothetical protein